MGIKLDTQLIKFIALFERITRAHVKDCFFQKEKLVFIVGQGDLGKSLGKNKANLLKLEKLYNRKLKIVEFSPNMLQFIVNILYPLKVVDMKEEDGVVTITGPDAHTKGLMIGAMAQNLRNLEGIVNKFFKVKEIRVI